MCEVHFVSTKDHLLSTHADNVCMLFSILLKFSNLLTIFNDDFTVCFEALLVFFITTPVHVFTAHFSIIVTGPPTLV